MLNRAQIIGRLGRDPEVRYVPGGEAVCNFTVATTERFKDKTTGETKEDTTWHRVSAWGRQAEIVGEYLRKGSLVYVEGKMTVRKYKDQSGADKESHEIRMQEMKMLGGRDGDQQQRPAPAARPAPAPAAGGAARPPARPPSGFDDMDDDIPFDQVARAHQKNAHLPAQQ
jgi:single-strand DNA-binding protein